MANPMEEQRKRELALRRQQELADLVTERTIGPRPLEGLSHAHTTWTEEQDESVAAEVHGQDEARSEALSESQVPPAPPDRALPSEGTPDSSDPPRRS
jgi:hypothetical protein